MRWRSYTSDSDNGKSLFINDESFSNQNRADHHKTDEHSLNNPDLTSMIDTDDIVNNHEADDNCQSGSIWNEDKLPTGDHINILGCIKASKAKCAILGGFLITLCLVNLQTMSNTGSYLISYMIKYSPDGHLMDESNILWIGSWYSLTSGISSAIGGYVELRCSSARYATLLGATLYSIGIISTKWTINYGYYYVLVSFGIIPGLGMGIAWTPAIINSFGWYPRNKGLASGIIMAGYGVGAFFFNFIITLIVNPDNLAANKTVFEQEEILKRVPNLFLKLGFTYTLVQLIGCILLFRPPPLQQQKRRFPQQIAERRKISNPETNDHHAISNQNYDDSYRPLIASRDSTNLVDYTCNSTYERSNIWSMILSKQFAVLFINIALSSQPSVFLSSMQKQYGQIYIKDDHFLSQIGSLSSLAVSIGKLAWGYASDKLSYFYCFTLISVIMFTTVMVLPFDFILTGRYSYATCILMAFGSMNGYSVILNVECFKSFGQRHASFLTGLVWIASTFNIPASLLIGHLYTNSGRFAPCFLLCSFTLLSETILITYTCCRKKRGWL